MGLEFQFALASASLWGVARDATYIVTHLHRHLSAQPANQPNLAPTVA
jgi:hypothetical protein